MRQDTETNRMRAITSPITLTKLMRVACWAVLILVVFAFDGHAQQLKDFVKLAGANDPNDAISMTISSGTATVLFTVTVTGSAGKGNEHGQLSIADFVAQGDAAKVIPTTMQGIAATVSGGT